MGHLPCNAQPLTRPSFGLDIVDGYLFDTRAWEQEFFGNTCKATGEGSEKARGYHKIRVQSGMQMPFIAPASGQGSFYHKPVDYLAIALYKSRRPLAQIVKDLDVMMNVSKFIPS
jgi:hypothetical protein